MKKEKHEKTTVTVRLTDEEDQVLSRLCTLKKTSKTGYLAYSAEIGSDTEANRHLIRGKTAVREVGAKRRWDFVHT